MRRLFALACCLMISVSAASAELTPIEQLGKHLMFDASLSTPGKMSCVTCHAPEAGWVSPDSLLNNELGIYHGSIELRFGGRKVPTSAYAGSTPNLEYDAEEEVWRGGLFWDGRATGWVLGDPLAEQALGPFLNPVEHNLPGARQLVRKVALSPYAQLFREVWGNNALDPVKGVAGAYERIGRSIAAYERSIEVNPFNSKYDAWLEGKTSLTAQEDNGRLLFETHCASCHPSAADEAGASPLFTNFTYDNLGIPKNPNNPYYTQPKKINPDGKSWVDLGLGGFLMTLDWVPLEDAMLELGKHRVPTLRNVDLRPTPDFVKAYGHNGYFKSLKEIVHFYNTRDVASWPPPEVAANVNTAELGNLGLSDIEEDDLVAFLKTLSDGYYQRD